MEPEASESRVLHIILSTFKHCQPTHPPLTEAQRVQYLLQKDSQAGWPNHHSCLFPGHGGIVHFMHLRNPPSLSISVTPRIKTCLYVFVGWKRWSYVKLKACRGLGRQSVAKSRRGGSFPCDCPLCSLYSSHGHSGSLQFIPDWCCTALT